MYIGLYLPFVTFSIIEILLKKSNLAALDIEVECLVELEKNLRLQNDRTMVECVQNIEQSRMQCVKCFLYRELTRR